MNDTGVPQGELIQTSVPNSNLDCRRISTDTLAATYSLILDS